MRPLYFLLWITLPYVLGVFYRRRKVLNTQRSFYAQTIFVCNHPSAFIDPLIIANYHRPIIHFMTRSDVFKPWLKPITWASHMVPIYRLAEDGGDSVEKNIASFKEAIKILNKKKCLIMFGEGYTDDVFIRSLKPLKKGPARIGFGAMVSTNWEQDIKVQTVGVNYTDPKYFNCEFVISGGPIIHLKDYKKIYDENPAKASTMLMREIEKDLQAQLTYVKDKSLAPFVENIQIIARKGMNHFYHDRAISIEDRYQWSKKTAMFVNENYKSDDPSWTELKSDLEQYFADEKKQGIDENWVYQFSTGKSKDLLRRFLYLISLAPIFLIGFVHMFIPYILIKKLVEKMFKRDVFWSGVKLLLGAVAGTLFNLPVIWLFHDYVYDHYLLAVLYYLIVPASAGIIAYNWARWFADTVRIMRTPLEKIAAFAPRRKALSEKIEKLGI